MDNKKTFEIYHIRKIPLLTNLLYFLFGVGVILSYFFLNFFGSKKHTPEILSFFLLTSSYGTLIIKIVFWTFTSTIVLMYLNLISKIKVKGVVIFNSNSFDIITKDLNETIALDNIKRVYCNDSEDRHGLPNKKFTMTIEKWKGKNRLLRIRDTNQIPVFIEKLLSYNNLKIEYFTLTGTDNNWH
jgi:hypothetical protein